MLRIVFFEYVLENIRTILLRGLGNILGYDHKRQTFELMADSLLILIVKIVNWNVS